MKNNLYTSIVNKPTHLEIVLGAVVSIFRSNFAPKKISIVPTVGNYKLIRKLNKKDSDFENFFIGIYRYKGRRYFIKTWTGKVRDTNYYLLLNEYISGSILHKKLVKKQSNYKILVPKVISCVKTENSFSVIFEYISGKQLSDYPLSFQAATLSRVIDCFADLSNELSEKERISFTKKSLSFYLSNLVPITIVTIFMNLHHTKRIVKVFYTSLVNIPSILGKKLVLSHGDLNSENILVSGSKIYLIDCERVALTVPGYDITHLSIIPDNKEIGKALVKGINNKINSFLTNFLYLHYLMSSNYTRTNKNFYLKSIYKIYG